MLKACRHGRHDDIIGHLHTRSVPYTQVFMADPTLAIRITPVAKQLPVLLAQVQCQDSPAPNIGNGWYILDHRRNKCFDCLVPPDVIDEVLKPRRHAGGINRSNDVFEMMGPTKEVSTTICIDEACMRPSTGSTFMRLHLIYDIFIMILLLLYI